MLSRWTRIPLPCVLLGLAAGGFGEIARAERSDLLVVVHLGTGAYEQAMEGFRAAASETALPLTLTVVDLSRKDASEQLARELNSPSTRVVVAVGPEAVAALTSGAGKIPLVSSLMLQSDAARSFGPGTGAHSVATLSLDVPIEAVLSELHRAFPDKNRVGIIRNPLKDGPSTPSLYAAARTAGFSVQVVECSRAELLLQAFLSLKNRVDFVWCLPDSDLYNSATVKPLLRASLGNQLPIIGFSQSFVQAGALLGLYPDFQEAGRQTAELVRKYLSGSLVSPHERVRSIRTSLNVRVARLLGLRPAAAYPPESRVSLP